MSTSSSRRPRQPPRPRKPPTAAQRERGDTRLYNPAADCPPLQLRTSGGEAAAALRSELCPLLLAKGRNHSSVRFEPQLRWQLLLLLRTPQTRPLFLTPSLWRPRWPLPRSSWAPMCHKRPGFYGLCFAGVPRASTLFLARLAHVGPDDTSVSARRRARKLLLAVLYGAGHRCSGETALSRPAARLLQEAPHPG